MWPTRKTRRLHLQGDNQTVSGHSWPYRYLSLAQKTTIRQPPSEHTSDGVLGADEGQRRRHLVAAAEQVWLIIERVGVAEELGLEVPQVVVGIGYREDHLARVLRGHCPVETAQTRASSGTYVASRRYTQQRTTDAQVPIGAVIPFSDNMTHLFLWSRGFPSNDASRLTREGVCDVFTLFFERAPAPRSFEVAPLAPCERLTIGSTRRGAAALDRHGVLGKHCLLGWLLSLVASTVRFEAVFPLFRHRCDPVAGPACAHITAESTFQ